MFKVGAKVVYPHHGAGTVVKKESREVLGQKRDYLTIRILHNDMTVQVPAENAEAVGLRPVIDEKMVEVVVKALKGGGTQMPKNWNRRFKHNRDKMKTGDVLELAEVVRNLSLRDHEKGLSTGEKQMFVKAKKILASELMYAKGMDAEEAAEWLEDVLSNVGAQRRQEAHDAREDRRRNALVGTSMTVWAVLAAAGSGERLGLDRPKAFANLRDRPLLAEPLERLEACEWIDSIVVAVPEGWEEPAILLAEELGAGKVVACVTGGATRAESVRAAVAEVPDDASVIVVHDAARPLVSDEIVERVLKPLGEGFHGAVPALPVADTIKRVQGGEVVETRRPRRSRRRADPAGVPRRHLRTALGGDVAEATDCSVARRGGRRTRRRRRGRPPPAQGDRAERPRARRAVALGGERQALRRLGGRGRRLDELPDAAEGDHRERARDDDPGREPERVGEPDRQRERPDEDRPERDERERAEPVVRADARQTIRGDPALKRRRPEHLEELHADARDERRRAITTSPEASASATRAGARSGSAPRCRRAAAGGAGAGARCSRRRASPPPPR